jgi:PRC-barrel domain
MTRNTRIRVMRELSMPRFHMSVMCMVAALLFVPGQASAQASLIRLAAGASDLSAKPLAEDKEERELTPEEKMAKRYPQPVRIGHLIGLPILDDDDSTIGYISQVVRSPEGKVSLIVPYSKWFGWCRSCWGKRPVAVPIEVVTILAKQLNAVDMSREDFNDADTWEPSEDKPIPPSEKTLIALGQR